MDNVLQLKSNRRYIVYRIFVITFLLLWLTFGLYDVVKLFTADYIVIQTPNYSAGYPNYFPKFFISLAPFLIPALFMIFNLAAFKFKFSVFGPYKRSPVPNEKPRFERTSGFPGSAIGWLYANGFSIKWFIYDSGLGISFLGAKAFIPKEKIKTLRKPTTLRERLFASFLPQYFYVVEHTSEEVRNPIILPKEVAQKLQEVIKNSENLSNQ